LQADDEEARKRRAAELHHAIEEATEGGRPPASPRELTDRKAREAAEESSEQDEESSEQDEKSSEQDEESA